MTENLLGVSVKDKILLRSIPEPNSGCWIWLAGVSGTYGRININGESVPTHRAAYEAFKGKIPKHLLVRHLCGNGLCVNPDHLEIGTYGDNAADKVKHGTSRTQKNIDAWKRSRVLTDDQIRLIRAYAKNGLKQAAISKITGIAVRSIRSYICASQAHYNYLRDDND